MSITNKDGISQNEPEQIRLSDLFRFRVYYSLHRWTNATFGFGARITGLYFGTKRFIIEHPLGDTLSGK
jgi:hypothetical protein